MELNDKKSGKTKRKSKASETLKDRVHRHLADKNDVITDEDIKSVEVGTADSEKAFRVEESIEEVVPENPDALPTQKKGNPWDILSEE